MGNSTDNSGVPLSAVPTPSRKAMGQVDSYEGTLGDGIPTPYQKAANQVDTHVQALKELISKLKASTLSPIERNECQGNIYSILATVNSIASIFPGLITPAVTSTLTAATNAAQETVVTSRKAAHNDPLLALAAKDKAGDITVGGVVILAAVVAAANKLEEIYDGFFDEDKPDAPKPTQQEIEAKVNLIAQHKAQHQGDIMNMYKQLFVKKQLIKKELETQQPVAGVDQKQPYSAGEEHEKKASTFAQLKELVNKFKKSALLFLAHDAVEKEPMPAGANRSSHIYNTLKERCSGAGVSCKEWRASSLRDIKQQAFSELGWSDRYKAQDTSFRSKI